MLTFETDGDQGLCCFKNFVPGPPRIKTTRNKEDLVEDVSWYGNPPKDLIGVGIGPPDAIGNDCKTRFSNSSPSLTELDSFRGDAVLCRRVFASFSDEKKDLGPPPLTSKL